MQVTSVDAIQITRVGDNLHLNHGPIDLLLHAQGEARQVQAAYDQVSACFGSTLGDLVQELPLLRQELSTTTPGTDQTAPIGPIARQMFDACMPYHEARLSPMAAVAGAVADSLLAAMKQTGQLQRAWVNNGGDIAFSLAQGEQFCCGVVPEVSTSRIMGSLTISAQDPVRGVATSGWATQDQGGRSFSLGIADAVTVLANNAADADVAATMIANQVDLPEHPDISRAKASELAPDSDLRERLVTTGVPRLSEQQCQKALERGASYARKLKSRGLLHFAILFLQNNFITVGSEKSLREVAWR